MWCWKFDLWWYVVLEQAGGLHGVLMLWLFVSFSLSNDRKIFLKCKRIIVKILMQFSLHEEISNLVFKKKSGIVKGFGMRPSSSLVTTTSSNSSVEYIQWLENEIIELKEARARDQEERAKDQEVWTKQDEVQMNILNFLRRKDYDNALTYGDGSTSS